LNRTGLLVSQAGHETASNYQFRYRDALIARGLWTAPAMPPERDDADVVIRRAAPGSKAPPGAFYRDRRHVAVTTHELP
jgi:hypothetical protein